MCCSSSLKKHKELGNVEEYRRRQVNTSRLFPFKIGKCPAPPSAQNWQKPVGPRYTIYCLERSGQKWSSWQTCSQNSVSLTCKVSKCSAEKWQKVIWTDEWKFKIFGHSRRPFCSPEGYRANECMQEKVKHSKSSLQVWGCISANGVIDLVRNNGDLNAEKNRQMLFHHAITSGRCMLEPKCIQHQDNDLNTQPRSLRTIFIPKNCVWDYMKKEKGLRKPISTEDL